MKYERGMIVGIIGVFGFLMIVGIWAGQGMNKEAWNWTPRPLPLPLLGNVSWMFLHNYAASIPEIPNPDQQEDVTQFFELFAKTFPCKTCGEHFQTLLQQYPPEVESRQGFMHYICTLHNHVNTRLSKPNINCLEFLDNWAFPDCDVCNP